MVKPGSPSVGNESEISGEETDNGVIANEISGTAEQSGVQKTSLTPGVEIGGVEGGDVVTPSGVSFKVSYTNVYLSYLYNNVWKHIDVETIPIIDHGEKGAQGFTGPVVRMRGEFKERDTGGYYSDGSAQKNYDESTDGIRYKDIVWYNNQYWTPNPEKCNGRSADGVPASYVTRHTGVIACYDPEYWPGGTYSYWVPATQFDFVATKLLYADQALINQISTHDLIATNQNGYPVAGVTSGSKMYDKDNAEITSYLSTLGTVNYSENADNDSANVRIFAGEIWNGSSYSLTYAPFNVRQDGTAYMTNANVTGDITANTLTLGDGSFKHLNSNGTSYILPKVSDNSTRSFYVLCDADNCTLNCDSSMTFRVSVGESGKLSNDNKTLSLSKSTFYQCISIKENNTYYWNIIATKISEGGGTEYKYIDITDDVQLIGYKYLSDSEKIILSSIDNISDIAGPLLTNTDNSIDIEFFTYLDPTLYGGDSENPVALADFGEFIWSNINLNNI